MELSIQSFQMAIFSFHKSVVGYGYGMKAKMLRLCDIPFSWDRDLPRNKIIKNPAGDGYLVGLCTDLHELIFQANLTAKDRRFLKALRILVEDID